MSKKYIWMLITLVLIAGSTIGTTVFASGKDTAASAISSMTDKAPVNMDKININTASVESLSQIPGLSPKIGEAIAAYRDANGAFKSLADLANIDGINAALLEKIKPFLSL